MTTKEAQTIKAKKAGFIRSALNLEIITKEELFEIVREEIIKKAEEKMSTDTDKPGACAYHHLLCDLSDEILKLTNNGV